jgi:hypothetical protein
MAAIEYKEIGNHLQYVIYLEKLGQIKHENELLLKKLVTISKGKQVSVYLQSSFLLKLNFQP